jgi:GDPmannose 4,6-dehydratase
MGNERSIVISDSLLDHCLSPQSTFRDALRVTGSQPTIAFITDDQQQFLGILTQGDVRDALIAGRDLAENIGDSFNNSPVTVSPDGQLNPPNAELSKISVIPVVENGKFIGYRSARDFTKTALITGVTGQDGSYLASYLLSRGYKVIGGYRRTSSDSFDRLRRLGILDQIELVSFDLMDMGSAISLIGRFHPHEIYNLAAQSFVQSSFAEPIATATYTGLGAMNLLEAVRQVDTSIRFYQASSSEMYGNGSIGAKNEATTFHPASPYATAKLFAHWATINYREAYGIPASCGILFNHESPLRGIEFVTRKITDAVAQIKLGKIDELHLGNLDSSRDWGYAPDYVIAMWQMLQLPEPEDFVIATGQTWTIKQFVEKAFEQEGLDPWKYVAQDRKYYRPLDVNYLLGDPANAVERFRFQPAKTSIDTLIRTMLDADLAIHQGDSSINVEWESVTSATST